MRRSGAGFAGIGVLCTAAAMLAGCGGGGSADTASATTPPTTTPSGTNHAPVISGAPATSVQAGQAYSFQPSATDADTDALTYSATNLPAWASINAQTGKVTGTPTATNVGSYANITIAVSDGKLSASLSSFMITVTQGTSTGTGTVSLSWMPPTTNSDGTALTDLTAFRIVYGNSATDLSQSVTITNPSISSYTLDNLSAGTWYFAVKSVNSRQDESDVSNVASKTI